MLAEGLVRAQRPPHAHVVLLVLVASVSQTWVQLNSSSHLGARENVVSRAKWKSTGI